MESCGTPVAISFPPKSGLSFAEENCQSSGRLDVTTAAESADGFGRQDYDSDGALSNSCESGAGEIYSCPGAPHASSAFAIAMSPAVVLVPSASSGNDADFHSNWREEMPQRTEQVILATDLSSPMREFSVMTDPQEIMKVCRKHLTSWRDVADSSIMVSKILSGLTNQLFSVEIRNGKHVIEPNRVLFRIYGKDVGQLYDPSNELAVYKYLAAKAVAPQCLAEFSGGRIEEWIDGHALAVEDARTHGLLVAMTKLIGRLHKLPHDEDFLKHFSPTPMPTATLMRWADLAKEIVDGCAPHDPQYERFQSLGLDEMVAELPLLEERLVPSYLPPNLATSIVFCHNDSQENNFMKVHGGDCLRLIDFEYAAFNYAGCDLANLLFETQVNYTHPVYPFYSIDEAHPPSAVGRAMCAAAYLSEVLDRPVQVTDQDIINPFLDSIDRMTLASHIMWGFWSVIRAPQAPTFEDFDYVSYGKARFDCYRRHLAWLIERGLIPSNPSKIHNDSTSLEAQHQHTGDCHQDLENHKFSNSAEFGWQVESCCAATEEEDDLRDYPQHDELQDERIR